MKSNDKSLLASRPKVKSVNAVSTGSTFKLYFVNLILLFELTPTNFLPDTKFL